ncbi:MAG: uncharacterized protein QOE55_1273 [Acidobacteriaceae bacterium]|nr:uncharacterized protein [Acidobacteriaceae bacterium]
MPRTSRRWLGAREGASAPNSIGVAVPVPYVAAWVDCDGTSVRGNLINVEPDPERVTVGMKVRLATHSMGTDEEGTEAIAFGFEPLGG